MAEFNAVDCPQGSHPLHWPRQPGADWQQAQNKLVVLLGQVALLDTGMSKEQVLGALALEMGMIPLLRTVILLA